MRAPEQIPGLERYEIGDVLGQGAAATVYRARDRELKREVALKVLNEIAGCSEEMRHRFQREARLAASIHHPNVISVHDVGEADQRLYLVMELVTGRSLQEALDRRTLDLPSRLRLLEKTARGLAAAHENGIVHRDVKPANIIIAEGGEPKVGDFGLAHFNDSQAGLTRTGAVLGTPLYMAPEQVEGRPGNIVPSTDVYALGAILYEMLTGRPPFVGDSLSEIYRQISNDKPRRPRDLAPGVARELEVIALKALEKDPALRYPHAGEFADDVRRFLDGVPVRAKPLGPVRRGGRWLVRHPLRAGATILAVALLAGVAAWVTQTLGAHGEYRAAYAEGVEQWNRILALARSGGLDRASVPALTKQAVDRFERAAAAAPHLPDPWVMIGRCRLLNAEEDAAEHAFSQALTRDPRSALAQFERGRYYFGRYAALRPPPNLRLSGGHIRVGPVPRETAEAGAWRQKGEKDLRAAEAAGALGYEELRYLAGALAYGEGRYADATRALETYATANPWDGRALAMLGQTLFFAGEVRAAEECLSRALRVEHRASWFQARGDVRCLAGRFKEAVVDYTDALKLAPEDAELWCSRGLAHQALRRWKDSLEDYSRAIEIRPDFPRAYNNRGTVHFEGKNYRLARREYEAALLHHPMYADAYNNLGNALLLEGNVEKAIEEFDTAVGLDERFGEAFYNRGVAWRARRDLAKAAADFQRSLQILPGNPEAHYQLALCLYESGKADGAVAELRKALEGAVEKWSRAEEAVRLLRKWEAEGKRGP